MCVLLVHYMADCAINWQMLRELCLIRDNRDSLVGKLIGLFSKLKCFCIILLRIVMCFFFPF